MKRLLPGPCAMVRFCSGHSPPLSQTGQSSGCEVSRNSSDVLRCPSSALSLTGQHRPCLPNRVVQAVSSLGMNWIFGCPCRPAQADRWRGRSSRPPDLHQAHAAHAHRLQLGVVAEDGDVDAGHLGGIHQSAFPPGRSTVLPHRCVRCRLGLQLIVPFFSTRSSKSCGNRSIAGDHRHGENSPSAHRHLPCICLATVVQQVHICACGLAVDDALGQVSASSRCLRGRACICRRIRA